MHSDDCKICKASEQKRKTIERLLDEGLSYPVIIAKYPELHLSRQDLVEHKQILDQPKKANFDRVKESLENELKELVGKNFSEEMKSRLELLCLQTTDLIKQALIECLAEQGNTKKLSETTSTLNRMIDALDSVSGIKQKASIDRAIETVTAAGYLIKTDEKVEENRQNFVPLSIPEFLAAKRQENETKK